MGLGDSALSRPGWQKLGGGEGDASGVLQARPFSWGVAGSCCLYSTAGSNAGSCESKVCRPGKLTGKSRPNSGKWHRMTNHRLVSLRILSAATGSSSVTEKNSTYSLTSFTFFSGMCESASAFATELPFR